MENKKSVLASDVDGIVLDYAKIYTDLIEVVLNRKPEIVKPGVFNLASRYGLSKDEAYRVRKEIRFDDIPPTPWASDFINETSKLVDRMIFVSALDNKFYSERCSNLNRLFGIDKRDVCCLGRSDKGKALHLFRVVFFIDDNPEHVISAQNSKIKFPYYFDNRYSDHDSGGIERRVYDVMDFVKEMEKVLN
jgi:hypothetical protein